MSDPIQSILGLHEQGDTTHIPEQRHAECCCGNEACAYLKHNQSALHGLERDLSRAGRLGKVRLSDHATLCRAFVDMCNAVANVAFDIAVIA